MGFFYFCTIIYPYITPRPRHLEFIVYIDKYYTNEEGKVSIQKSVLMLTNTSEQYEKIGDPIRADGWWGNTDGLHTVSVKVSNFKGFFKLEGTLSMNPTENDWFPIYLNANSTSCPCIEYDYETSVKAFTFVGNFVFLRARLVREQVDPPLEPSVIQTLGTIDKVLLAL